MGDRTIGEAMDAIASAVERALELGFTAVKMEVLFGDLVTDRQLVGCIEEGRRLVGEEILLLVAVETRVGGAELAATVGECREWLREGCVDVLQPDVGRCGGLTELRRIAELAELEGRLVIPHGWKTGITLAASCHFAAATPNAPLVEFLHPALFDSPLRAELTTPEPVLEGGRIPLLEAPGLGVELVAQAVERYSITAPRR